MEYGDGNAFFDSRRNANEISLPILMSKYAGLGRDIVIKSLAIAAKAAIWKALAR